MDTDLPVPIDDSLPFSPQQHEEQESQPRFYREPEQMYYYRPPPTPQIEQVQKKDVFSELGRTHWILFISAVLLAFFMGKSISTPIIIRST